MMPTSKFLAEPEVEEATVYSALRSRGVSRRRFLQFCSVMTATLALPDIYMARVADALETKARPVMVWLEFQDCAGNSESMLRSSSPDIAAFVLDLVSLNYHEVLMAGSGKYAEKALADSISQYKGKYLVVVEGAIPQGDGGVYCTIGGRTAHEHCAGSLQRCGGGDRGGRVRVGWRPGGCQSEPYRRDRIAGGAAGNNGSEPGWMPAQPCEYGRGVDALYYVRRAARARPIQSPAVCLWAPDPRPMRTPRPL